MPSVAYNAPNSLPVRKPAPFVIGPTNKTPLRPTNKIPQHVIDAAQATPVEEFDAKKHVNFEFPQRTYTKKEWGYESQGISLIAASDPFPLFTEAAVKQVRRELPSEDALRTCQYASTFAKNQIRGYSQSFPFVGVTMLSDCSDMKGGETAVLKGDGQALKVRGPTMDTAVLLQGPFRPRSPFVKDELVLTGSRPISNQSELLYDYCTYRTDTFEIRFRDHAKRLREQQAAGIKFNPDAVREFIQEQKEMLKATLLEMIPIYNVVEVE
ncbi:hypothetical protein FBEOM_2694 [Fusarium beomiforme]|uniref:Uncharacterized protein n=1 Tax=Fusarium beomiforme TaxID=44412 RepID=A0A9P5ARM1_9HYPO|nr:hypothetical protein FBEOM_2694 [Fusarium beomiforme]